MPAGHTPVIPPHGKIDKCLSSFMPTKPLRLAVGFSVFLAMIMAPLTTTVLTVGTTPAFAVTPEEILGDQNQARARTLKTASLFGFARTNPLTIVMPILRVIFGLRCVVRSPPDRVMKISLTRFATNTRFVLFNPPLDRGGILWLAPIGFVGLAGDHCAGRRNFILPLT